MAIIRYLASLIGVPAAALTLLISILLGYPLAYIYRTYIHPFQSKEKCQLSLALTGIFLCIFNYGFGVYHSLLAVIMSYLFIQFLPRSTLLVPVSFAFHFGYLMIGYYFTTTENYDITWTMPHCVLVLRLIGLSFDVADGALPEEKLSKDMKRLRIVDKPSLLEIATYTYFPATFLVGPQFSLERLRRYLNHEFDQFTGYQEYGLKRFGLGAIYLAFNQLLALYVPDSYFLSEEFENKTFIVRLFESGLWGKMIIYKYISCWMLAEGAAISFGLSYNGKTENGEEDWTGCANIKLYLYETSRKFGHYIEAFNIQTNQWVAHYVFKRLKFLGNKNASHILALFFLALWHGFHCGYYMTFALEFIVVLGERNVETVLSRNENVQNLMKQPSIKFIVHRLLNLYVFLFAGWNLTPFVFLKFHKWWQVYKSLNFIGYIIFVPAAFFAGPILKVILPPSKRATETSKKTE